MRSKPGRETEPLRDAADRVVGLIVRDRRALLATLELRAERLDAEVWKLSVTIENRSEIASATSTREEAALHSFLSTHMLLGVEDGQFVSPLEPPETLAAAAAGCRNEHCWPILVGSPGSRDRMLSSPIILYDYADVSPESSGDFFDGTEIDEMLALRVQTMTDGEKREMRSVDARARKILERVESFSDEQLLRLHGATRPQSASTP